MSLRAVSAPLWFVAALVPMVLSQIVRLEQSDPATWIFWDYAGRLGALAVLGCAHQKPKSGRSGDKVRQGLRVN